MYIYFTLNEAIARVSLKLFLLGHMVLVYFLLIMQDENAESRTAAGVSFWIIHFRKNRKETKDKSGEYYSFYKIKICKTTKKELKCSKRKYRHGTY